MAKQISIDEVRKELKKVNQFGDIIANSEYTRTKERIGTGNYHLNALFSGDLFGGVPCNRGVAVAGESGVGKTYFMLNIAREAQNMGYYPIYYDSEGAVDADTVVSFGIDPTKFDHQPVSDLAKFRTSITTLIKKLVEAKEKGFEIPKIAIFLDSLSMLATTKEIDDAISGNTAADMTRAKMIRSLFRIITADLAGLSIPLIFSNHTYACLPGGYSIYVEDGVKNIEDIKPGDKVKTLVGYQPVEDIFTYENAELLEIELENGEILKCTPNHKFLVNEDWTQDSSWVKAIDLKEGDFILKNT